MDTDGGSSLEVEITIPKVKMCLLEDKWCVFTGRNVSGNHAFLSLPSHESLLCVHIMLDTGGQGPAWIENVTWGKIQTARTQCEDSDRMNRQPLHSRPPKVEANIQFSTKEQLGK